MLKCVPFNSAWISHEKIDIHAIYRRPRFVSDKYGDLSRELDANGIPTWDLTGPLPVKQHIKWSQKGFEYVTLANREALHTAAATGTLLGGTPRDYDQHRAGGPWNYRLYSEGQTETYTAEVDQLREDIARFGPEAVETLRRRQDPTFTLPDSLKKPKGTKAAS